MNRPLPLLLLALALALGIGLFLYPGSADPTVPGSGGDPLPQDPGAGELTGGPSGKALADNPTRRAVTGGTPGFSTEPAAYQRALSGIRGRLVWQASRQPLAGVEVKIGEAWLDAIVPRMEDIAGISKMRTPVLFRATARTDADGVFHLRGVHSRALLFLAIGLQTDKAGLRVIDRSPLPGELMDLGDVELQERGSVTGRVLDDAGQPVAGAVVRVADIPKIAFQFGVEHFDPEGMVLWVQGPYRVVLQIPKWLKEYDDIVPIGRGVTGADGRFNVPGVKPGNPTMVISKPDHAPITRSVAVVSHQETALGTLTMPEGEYLSGRFVDPAGKPVAGVAFTIGGTNSMIPVAALKRARRSAADGKFEMSGLPSTPLYLVYQRKQNLPWEVSGPHRGDDEVDIVLGGFAQGLLRVVQGTTEKPYEGPIEFSFCVADESSYMPGFETMLSGRGHFVRRADKRHEFDVRELPVDTYRVIARAEGFVLASGVLRLKTEDKTATIRMIPAPKLRFEVTDREGDPIEAARIYWNAVKGKQDRTRQDMARLPMLVGKTDAKGVLETATIPLHGTHFYARHPAYALAAQREIPTDRIIRLVLGRTGSLEGMLAEDGNPPAEERTVVAEPTGSSRRQFAGVLMPSFAQTGPDGSFRFGSLQPGTWRLRAIPSIGKMTSFSKMFRMRQSGEGRGPVQQVEVVEAATGFVRLELKAPATAKGNGSLIGSVRVSGRPAKGAWVQTWAGRQQADVKEDGSFVLNGLEDGDLWISVERPGHSGMLPNRLWEGRIKIVGGSQESLHLDLQTADVSVKVFRRDGATVAGLLLVLVGKSTEVGGHRGQTRMAVTTDSDGVAEFAAVPRGEYVVRSAMQRQAAVVVPDHPVQVFGATVAARVTATLPAVASGTVRWDESELADDLERAYARERRPTYLVFESNRRFIWGPLREAAGVFRFTMRPGPPGHYWLQSRGELRWSSSKLDIPLDGTDRAEVVLRPDAAQVKAAVAKLRPPVPNKPASRPKKSGGVK